MLSPEAGHTIIVSDVQHLMVEPKGDRPADGFTVSLETTIVEIHNPPLSGMANVVPLLTAPCGSDSGRNGYYWGGRYARDLTDTDKLDRNLRLMQARGMKADGHALLRLLTTPNHEGVVVVLKSTPDPNDKLRYIAAFVPSFSPNERDIVGVHYEVVQVYAQELQPGTIAVGTAYLRCDQHWQIPDGQKFPGKCHRSTENGHVPKQVPGHGEMPGWSFSAEHGLPYPNQMFIPVPETVMKWVNEDPKQRMVALLATEPLSCCLEAFHPILLNVEEGREQTPKRIAILGDGPNAALLTLTATTAFPTADIYVTGRTATKLDAIAAINPERVHPLLTERTSGHRGYEQLRDRLVDARGNTIQLDVIIPTFHVDDLTHYKGLVNTETGWVIAWAADQVGTNEPFTGLVQDKHIHHSYGGWNWAEYSALELMKALVERYPERLQAIVDYPYLFMGMEEAGPAMDQWLGRHGRYEVKMDNGNGYDRTTSAKIVIDHRDGVIFDKANL